MVVSGYTDEDKFHADAEDTLHILRETVGIRPTELYGHRDFKNTACPGDRLYALLPRLRTDVAAVLGQRVSAVVKASWPLLQQGDRGPEVTAAQYLLRDAHVTTAAPTGVFDVVTDAAVRRFQAATGAEEVNGLLGGESGAAGPHHAAPDGPGRRPPSALVAVRRRGCAGPGDDTRVAAAAPVPAAPANLTPDPPRRMSRAPGSDRTPPPGESSFQHGESSRRTRRVVKERARQSWIPARRVSVFSTPRLGGQSGESPVPVRRVGFRPRSRRSRLRKAPLGTPKPPPARSDASFGEIGG
jgi:peptidoglycan hydrolase-like protein with peptidoglycan-binding domain